MGKEQSVELLIKITKNRPSIIDTVVDVKNHSNNLDKEFMDHLWETYNINYDGGNLPEQPKKCPECDENEEPCAYWEDNPEEDMCCRHGSMSDTPRKYCPPCSQSHIDHQVD